MVKLYPIMLSLVCIYMHAAADDQLKQIFPHLPVVNSIDMPVDKLQKNAQRVNYSSYFQLIKAVSEKNNGGVNFIDSYIEMHPTISEVSLLPLVQHIEDVVPFEDPKMKYMLQVKVNNQLVLLAGHEIVNLVWELALRDR